MWGVPVNDEVFEGINSTQWLWYFHNFVEDRNEGFVHDRDMVEYEASFVEPEAVRKIKEARDKKITVSNEQFDAGLKRMFGRSMPKVQAPSGDKIECVDVDSAIKSYNKMMKEQSEVIDRKGLDYKYWLALGDK